MPPTEQDQVGVDLSGHLENGVSRLERRQQVLVHLEAPRPQLPGRLMQVRLEAFEVRLHHPAVEFAAAPESGRNVLESGPALRHDRHDMQGRTEMLGQVRGAVNSELRVRGATGADQQALVEGRRGICHSLTLWQ